jgi:ERF superfamily
MSTMPSIAELEKIAAREREAAPKTAPSLVRKLAAVMGEVERIPKSGRNEFHKYDYATEADIVAAVRKGLAERSVMILHRVDELAWRESKKSSGEAASPIATVHVTFTAHDGDTGETLVVAQTVGEGQDSGDKAVYKALTGALKYAILKLFLIPTGHDPEASKKRPTDQRDPPPGGGLRPAIGPTAFPNFGKAKGEAISGATVEHLEWYLAKARESLADPEKAKWHAKESALIGAYESELARQRKPAPSAATTAPAAGTAPTRPAMVDVREGESEEHAKQRAAGVFYAQAVKLGAAAGWEQPDVGKWLRENLGRSAKSDVTAEDVEAFRKKLEPPVEPGWTG